MIEWVAGIVEGEGSIGVRSDGSAGISVSMTDFDVIEALYKRTEVGNIHGPYVREDYKPQWHWTVTHRVDVRELLEALRPFFFFSRRERQADKVLAFLDEVEARRGLPKGVSATKSPSRYQARFRGAYLGTFGSVEEAKEVYEQTRKEYNNGTRSRNSG